MVRSDALRDSVQRPNTIALIGDSITWFGTEWDAGDPTLRQNHSRGAFPWANAFLRATNQGLTLVRNFAIPAQAMGDMIPQMDQVLALNPRPGYLLLHAGINNIISDLPLDDLKVPFNTIANRCEAAGIRLIATTLLAGSNTEVLKSASRRQKFFAFNAWLRTECAARGIALCDWYAVTADANGEPLPETFTDGTHPAAPASFRAGRVLADTIRSLLPCCASTARSSDPTPNLLRNGTFTGYSGLRADGVTGDVATGWTVQLLGSGVATPALVHAKNGAPVVWQELSLRCDAPSHVMLAQDIVASSLVGNRVRASIELERGEYWQNISATTLGVACFTKDNVIAKQSIDLSGADNQFPLPDVNWRAVLETQPIVVPAGTTRIRVSVNLYGLHDAHGRIRVTGATLQ